VVDQLAGARQQGPASLRSSGTGTIPGVREVLQGDGPATLFLGCCRFNVFTDLFFASGASLEARRRPRAPAIFAGADPLGLLFEDVLLAFALLPVFARLNGFRRPAGLGGRIRQGLMLSNASMLPLGALMVGPGRPDRRPSLYEAGGLRQPGAAGRWSA